MWTGKNVSPWARHGSHYCKPCLKKWRKAPPSLRKSDLVLTIPNQPFSEHLHIAPVRSTQQQPFSGQNITTLHTASWLHNTLVCTDC
jgi:hypothetical protein